MTAKHLNFSDEVDYQRYIEERIKKDTKRNEISKYGYYPNYLGKVAYFKEHFDGISLDKQPNVKEILEDEQLKPYFEKGYNTAKILVEKGFTRENYEAFLQSQVEPQNISPKRR